MTDFDTITPIITPIRKNKKKQITNSLNKLLILMNSINSRTKNLFNTPVYAPNDELRLNNTLKDFTIRTKELDSLKEIRNIIINFRERAINFINKTKHKKTIINKLKEMHENISNIQKGIVLLKINENTQEDIIELIIRNIQEELSNQQGSFQFFSGHLDRFFDEIMIFIKKSERFEKLIENILQK